MLKNGLFALTTLVFCGCGVAVGEDEPDSLESEKVDQKTEAIDTEPPFQIGLGSNSYAELVSADTHFCFLSGVWGTFSDGVRDKVSVFINDAWNWDLRTGPYQSGSAICAGKNWFLSYFGGTERSFDWGWASANSGGGCPVASKTMWRGQAVTYLSSMVGSFRGGGEAIWINQGPTGSALSTLFAKDCQADGSTVVGEAFSYFVGNWAFDIFGCSAFYWRNTQPSGEPFSTMDVTPYGVNNPGTGADESTLMANVSDAVCALTKVTGKFSGGCEYALIEPSGPRWQLRVHACSGRAVYAEARCFARVQC